MRLERAESAPRSGLVPEHPLVPQLPKECTSEAGDANYKMLFIFCTKGDDADAKPLEAKKLMVSKCGELAAQGFTKVQVAGSTEAWTAVVSEGGCPFDANESAGVHNATAQT